MPYPAQLDRPAILRTAIEILESEGIEALSLHKLAEKLGVKAPSLYRHMSSKSELLLAINRLTFRQLIETMQAAVEDLDDNPREAVLAMMMAYRSYAQAHPVAYVLAFAPELPLEADFTESLAMPLQAIMAEYVGEVKALAALRGAWALVHGFVTLEMGGHFRRGGDIDEAFRRSLDAYLSGWRR
jgi:AcrR family transcriptional regulator